MKKANTSPTGPRSLEEVLGPLLVELEGRPVGPGHDHQAEQRRHDDRTGAGDERHAASEPLRAGLALGGLQVVAPRRGVGVVASRASAAVSGASAAMSGASAGGVGSSSRSVIPQR